MAKDAVETVVRRKVWDLPVRLYHWCQAGLLVGLWWTAEQGDMEWHLFLAYSLIALWSSRIVWGFVGSETARFSQFLRSPIEAFRYLRGKPHTAPGHNPAGGWMVVLLITLVAVQFGSGLFTSDDIFTEGPLYSAVSSDVSSLMGQVHEWNFDVLLGAVAMHLLAVAVYELKGHRLVVPMFSGKQKAGAQTVDAVMRPVWIWLVILAVFAGGIYYWWQPEIPW
ncbi:cytochrome b/b6 domain-containing protein [Corallincola platygyrae]|uniref:Cytochrome b/b6 domain-containing protein n=1 Tax=Corallincola platygyrae TaxID=1193278 RepID=A0ABW4XQV8_9GAMM